MFNELHTSYESSFSIQSNLSDFRVVVVVPCPPSWIIWALRLQLT